VLLMLEAALCTPLGRTVDYSYSYYLPGYFRFHVNRKIGSPQPLISLVQEAGNG
jgi:GntR family transcriptional regulator